MVLLDELSKCYHTQTSNQFFLHVLKNVFLYEIDFFSGEVL